MEQIPGVPDLATLTDVQLADLRAGGMGMIAAYSTVITNLANAIEGFEQDLNMISLEISKRVARNSN